MAGGAPRDWPVHLRVLAAVLSRPADAGLPSLGAADWDRLSDAAIRTHRVAPLTLRGLRRCGFSVPEAVIDRLRAETETVARAALLQKAETLRLLPGLPCAAVVFKGWPLGERLTGATGLRHAKDIDLLIGEADVAAAYAALTALGYRPLPEHRLRADSIADPAVLRECNELNLHHPGRRVGVELHWRSNHFRGGPDLKDLSGEYDIHPPNVMVPSDGAHLVYLALHGESHLWLRLKWLLDIHLAAGLRDEALLQDLALARSIGAEPALRLALLLSGRVFGTQLPPQWPAPEPVDLAAAAQILRLIGRGVMPGDAAARVGFYRFAMQRAGSRRQVASVLRYLVWRRVCVGAAALRRRAGQ